MTLYSPRPPLACEPSSSSRSYRPPKEVNIAHCSLDYLLLNLFNHLVNPHLYFLLLGLRRGSCHFPSLFSWRSFLFAQLPPGVPLVHEALAVCEQVGGNVALSDSVLFIERPAVFTQVLADQSLLLLRQQRTGPRSPNELLELVEDVLLKLLTPEVPDTIAVLDLPRYE